MAKKLSTKQWLQRALDRGISRKDLAGKLGRSTSTIGDIIRGRRPGENLREAARDLAQGKRKPIAPPPSKGKPAKRPPKLILPKVSPLVEAQGKLDELKKAGVGEVAIIVRNKKTGRENHLFASDGIDIDQISNLRSTIHGQSQRQGNNSSISDPLPMYDIDEMDEIDSDWEIDVDEF